MSAQSLARSIKGRPGLPVVLALVAALPFACQSAPPEGAHTTQAGLSPPTLGVAASFRVLGGSTVTNTGPTTVDGDLGVSPGSAITGFPPGQVLGVGAIHAADATALQAQSDVTAAYIVLAGEPCAHDLTGQDLGGLKLTQGVYCFSSEAQLTGTLTLDAQGDPSAVFVFQIVSKLTTASNSSVAIINAGQDCRVFWQVGSSATLGTGTAFAGSVLALTSIALDTGTSVSGRVLARNGEVTLDGGRIFGSACVSGSDAGVDSAAAEAGNEAGIDGTAAESGASEAAAMESGGGVDASGADAGSEAEAGETLCCGGVLCGAACTSLSGDIANCGACGHACASDQFCAAGACVACSPVCGGACVDFGSDVANCGACGQACAQGESCTSGACVPCPMLCGGACVDFASDGVNCGSCGHACTPSESCTGGACVACPQVCGGACVDLTSDRFNCGSCGLSCAPGESCKSGSCVCQ